MNLRRLIAWWAGLLATLGGCGALFAGVACMGVRVPPPHPTVKLSAQPAAVTKNANGSRTITVHANAQHAKDKYNIELKVYEMTQSSRNSSWRDRNLLIAVAMRDDGLGGDTLADDGRWFAEYTVDPATQADYEADVYLYFPRDDYMWQTTQVAQFSTIPRHDTTLPPHPKALLTGAQLTSPAQLKPGQSLSVTAHTTGPADEGTMVLIITRSQSYPGSNMYCDEYVSEAELYDDGTHGDDTAGDGEWHGAWVNSATEKMYAAAEVELYFEDYLAQRATVPGVITLDTPPDGGAADGTATGAGG